MSKKEKMKYRAEYEVLQSINDRNLPQLPVIEFLQNAALLSDRHAQKIAATALLILSDCHVALPSHDVLSLFLAACTCTSLQRTDRNTIGWV